MTTPAPYPRPPERAGPDGDLAHDETPETQRLRSICVYCGSADDLPLADVEAAAAVGRLLAARDIRVVYGGGSVGLMGVAARAAFDAGGEVLGILPTRLFAREVGDQTVGDLVEVASMHERKQRMFDEADGFVALPGGLGTLEELAEQLTWAQLGLHAKPIGVLNVRGHYDLLIGWLDHAVETGYLRPEVRALLHVDSDVEALLAAMEAAAGQPPLQPKWLADLDET